MPTLQAGDRIDRYRVDSVLLDRDGAVVYAATEDETSRSVAISVVDEKSDEPSILRARAARAEQAAGLARIQAVEPLATGRLPDGRAFVVNERIASLPIIARSAAPIGAVFGSTSAATPMDAGRAVLALTSQRAQRRAVDRLGAIARRALLLAVVVGAGVIVWLLAAR